MTESLGQDWHEILGLRPTNLDNFFTRPGPSGEFNPLTATADELARCGIPPRPDSEREPEEHMRWRRRYGRALRFIEPELVVRPHKRRAPLAGPGTGGASPNWAGYVVVPDEGLAFSQISGSWVVPGVTPPAFPPYLDAGAWSSVTWVGLDGAGASGDVFQAGTEQYCFGGLGFGGTEYFAWTEWFPAPPVAVVNFQVEPGDVMVVIMEITLLDGPDFPAGFAFIEGYSKPHVIAKKKSPRAASNASQ
jgi:Peptidase A4 family